MPSNESLAGRIVVVTGASRGLGKGFARALYREDAQVVLMARASNALDAVGAEMPKAMVQPCDLSSPDSVRAAFNAIGDRFGKLDALVNNAALLQPSPIEAMTDEHMLRETLTNFMGPALTARAAIPLMRAAGGGDIVNISSDSVISPGPHLTFYAAAKAGVEQLSIGLRQELRGEKIRVTILRSGPVADSELHRGWTPEGREAFYGVMRESGALDKFGEAVEPEVMAQTLIHLLRIPRTAIADTISLRPI